MGSLWSGSGLLWSVEVDVAPSASCAYRGCSFRTFNTCVGTNTIQFKLRQLEPAIFVGSNFLIAPGLFSNC